MSDLQERKFGFVNPPPPPPPGSPYHVTMADWMQYINSYMDVRARQMYDKLKGLYEGGSGEYNKIEGIDVNGVPQRIVDKVAKIDIDIPDVPSSSKELSYNGGTMTTFSKIETVSTSVGDLESSVNDVKTQVSGIEADMSDVNTKVETNTATLNGVTVVLDSHIFDSTSDDYFILRDKSDPSKKYKVFIQDGTVCSDEIK